MKFLTQWGWRGLLALVLAMGAAGIAPAQQTDKKDDKIKVSSGENDLAKKLQDEKLPLDKKFEIAQKLLEKYPKSQLRPRFAEYLLGVISDLKDPEQRISQVETFLGVFTDAGEQEMAVPALVDAYQAAKRWDDAFGLAPRALEKKPDNVVLLTQLAIGGTDLARSGKKDYFDQTKQYTNKGIELMLADKKPGNVSASEWADFKKQWLPQLYYSQGLQAALGGNPKDARASYQKGIALNPTDPYGYFLSGILANEEYQELVKQYKVTPAGPAQDAKLKEVHSKMDEVIELYAQTIALADGKPAYKAISEGLLQDVQAYYKVRKGSLDGLQALINKYKK